MGKSDHVTAIQSIILVPRARDFYESRLKVSSSAFIKKSHSPMSAFFLLSWWILHIDEGHAALIVHSIKSREVERRL